MADAKYSCVKCGDQTVKGFLADRTDAVYFTARWVDGEPVNRTFLGIAGDNIDISQAVERAVRGLRCKKCGYLELYAV